MRLLLLFVFVHQIFARSEAAQLTSSNFFRCLNPFALDIMKKLEYDKKNVVYSTLSIGLAVGMLLEGAQEEEKGKLFKLLHCDNYGNRDTIHQQFKALLDEYKTMNTRNENPRNATVELANLAMIQEEVALPKMFTDALEKYYEAAVQNENFVKNGQRAVDKINAFVKEKTHGLIQSLFSEPLDPATVMVLINTIYFKAYWEDFFTKESTHKAPFYNADKSNRSVEMMRKYETDLKYFDSNKYKASFVEMPYLGQMSMFVVLPKDKYGLPEVIANWKPNDLPHILSQMETTNLNIHFPKFEFDHTIDLKDAFKKLGVNIENVLKPVPNSLKISEAVHKAKIRTHEAGTEAAAVTGMVAMLTSLQYPRPKVVNVDHPFLFLIQDTKSKVNLFAGVVNQL